MPISEQVYSVYLDGRPSQRGLSRAVADAHADYLARGIERKKASDKRRAPCIEVKLDQQITREEDALYRWAKQGGS
jgi:hypothetical protein